MPLRMGELMVVVRAQDFASRTLRRVGGELAGLSKQQQLARMQTRLGIRQAETFERINLAESRMRDLSVLKNYVRYQQISNELTGRQARLNRIAQTGRDPLGRFVSRAGVQQAVGALSQVTPHLARIQAKSIDLRAAIDKMTPDMQRLAVETGKWEVNSKLVDRQVARQAATLRRLRPELAFIAEDQEVLNQAVRRLPVERMERLGHAMSGLGRTFQLFGAIGTVSLGLAAASAANFATQASLAATQMRDIAVQSPAQALTQIRQRTDQLTNGFKQAGVPIEGILGLMQKYPATAEDMSAAAYDIFSSMNLQRNGIIDVAAGLQLLEKANQIAVAGQVDLAEATNAMITVLNNFGGQGQKTNEILDTMFDIVRFGRMRISDFNIMMNKIAPAAAGAGQSLEDVGGAMAFLTQVMPSQRMVATGISRLIEAFKHPDIVAGLKSIGINALDANKNLRPLDDLLTEIHQKLDPRDAAEFFRLISAAGRGGGRGQIFTAEGRRAFNQVMRHFDDYIAAQREIEKNTGEFGVSLQAQLESIGVQWAVFRNQLRALVIVIGSEAVPVFKQIGGYIEQFVTWFRNLDPELRGQIVRWAVWASVGTLLAGVFLAVVGSITSLLAAMRLITMTGGGVATTLSTVWQFARLLGGLGAIAIMLKVAWQGEATAIDFLLGAAFGAAAGSVFGAGGAILGAVTVPIILKVISEQMKTPFEKAFDEYQQQFKSGFQKFMEGHGAGAVLPLLPLKPEFDKRDFEHQWNMLLYAQHVGYKGLSVQLRREVNAIDPQIKALFKKFMPDPKTKVGTKEYFDELRKNIKGAGDSATDGMDALQQFYDAMNEGAATGIDRQKELARVMEQTRQQTIDSLRQMYMQMEQENRRAFGDLMQGPWLTSETFDLAKEWGITPRIQDMIRDLHAQNEQFAKWRSSLDRLLKKGLPRGFIDELRQMGPEEGQPLLDQIMSAKPGQVNKLIGEWRRREKQIKAATKMDFTQEIRAFQKAGGDMGRAMIEGFESAQVGLWFDNWVQATFPGVINAAVAQAVADWKAANPPTKVPTIVKPTTTTTTTNNTDNSKTVHVNVPVGVGEAARDAAREAEVRRIAFIATNIFRKTF